MNLAALRDLIRFEAQIVGADTANGFINATINEVLREYTARVHCPELLFLQVIINAPIFAPFDVFELPTDLQHFDNDRVFWGLAADGFDKSECLFKGDFDSSNVGNPRVFRRTGTRVVVWPFASTADSAIWIDYYQFPFEISQDADPFPIPYLEKVVKLETCARLSRISSTDRSTEFHSEAEKAFSATRATNL